MANFAEQCEDGDGFLSIDIGVTDFGFGGKSHDVGHDFRHGLNRSIETRAHFGRLCRIRRAVAEKIITPGAALCTGCRKVQGVAVDVYNHVTCGVPNGGVGNGISIVEEPQGCIVGLFGDLRLLGREGAKGDEHGGINVNVLIQECANYLLHKVNELRGQQWGVVVVFGVLDFGAVGGGFPGMWGILRVWRLRVLKFV